MSTLSLSSIEQFVAAVEAAEQRLTSGESKTLRAKALLLQAEKAREEASARRAGAEQQLEAIEGALRRARLLRVLLGDQVISQGETLLEQVRAEAQTEVTRLQVTAKAAQAETEQLLADPEVKAYLEYREAQERARQEARERERESLEAQLAALRPGAAIGQGAEPMADLATRAERAGFPELAAEARDAAEAASRVAQVQIQAGVALHKRRLHRWAQRRVRRAQPGDFVFIVDEEAGTALHLRPVAARSGRLRFQVVAPQGMESPVDEYSDVPSRGRAWRWWEPPIGEPEGLTEAQTEVVDQIVRGKLRSGWSINRANACLARRVAKQEAREAARKPQDVPEVEAAQEALSRTVSTQPTEHRPPASEWAGASPPEADATTGLEGLSPRVAVRLWRVGLKSRVAVEEMLAAGDPTLLNLPGIGPATLKAVQGWVNDLNSKIEPDVEGQGEMEGKHQSLREPGVQAQAESEEPLEEGIVDAAVRCESTVETRTLAESELAAGDAGEGVSDGIGLEATTQGQREPQAHSRDEIPEPAITVEGDGVSGQRLTLWRGVAQIGLVPVARRLRLHEVQMLVHEEDGEATLVVFWPGGETTISCPVDGRAGQLRAVREVIRQIQAAA